MTDLTGFKCRPCRADWARRGVRAKLGHLSPQRTPHDHRGWRQAPGSHPHQFKDGLETVSSLDVLGQGRVVVFAVPGAFTPTCSNKHLPGYIQHMEDFRERGIKVACISVNDAFVMHAWGISQGVPDDLLMLGDGNATFAIALGLELDGTKNGMGIRSKRFAIYAEDGVVKLLHVEAPGEFRVTAAEAMLEAIDA